MRKSATWTMRTIDGGKPDHPDEILFLRRKLSEQGLRGKHPNLRALFCYRPYSTIPPFVQLRNRQRAPMQATNDVK